MRRPHCALCVVVAIDAGQSPMIVSSLSVVQSTNVRKSAQQSRDGAERTRFKVLEGGF
jgi:hypothetical protein